MTQPVKSEVITRYPLTSREVLRAPLQLNTYMSLSLLASAPALTLPGLAAAGLSAASAFFIKRRAYENAVAAADLRAYLSMLPPLSPDAFRVQEYGAQQLEPLT